jgi:transposase
LFSYWGSRDQKIEDGRQGGEVVKRNKTARFVVLPKRRVVERSFAWLANYRRLTRDYEINPRQSETMIKLAMK